MRELLIASTFGASALTDAFNVAFRIPNLFRRLFAEGAFSQAFVPVLAASRQQQGDEATHVLINQVATLLIWALLLTCVLGVVGAPLLVWGMASGLQQSPHSFEVAVVMTRLMFPYIAFMSLVALAAGVLNTWKRFAVPAATPVLLNVAMIGAAWWGGPWFGALGVPPIYALAVGVMLGGVAQLSVQLWALRRLGMLPRVGLSWRAVREAWGGEGPKRILQLMAPALLGVSVAQISLLINTQIASQLTPGSVSWLSYADRLMEFPTALLGVALGVVLMPQLSAAKAAKPPLNYGSAGSGSSQHLAGALFANTIKIEMGHIPYKGGAPALVDLMGGRLDAIFAPLVEVLPFIQGKKLKALAVTTPARSFALPDVPTVAETFPGFDITLWNSIMTRSGTPPEIIAKLSQAIQEVLEQPDVLQTLRTQGSNPSGNSPSDFKTLIAQEVPKWAEIIKLSGAEAQ